jgi:GSH-dependent disulfide-bond oxidoreductase
MITLYTWTTPNGRKISVALEEMGLPYEIKPIDLGANEQFTPEFLAVSPNNKIPGIVDHGAAGGPVSVFESGAILVYLAERSGLLLPSGGAARAKVLEWLFWQIGGIGPMFGQLFYFAVRAEEKAPLAIARFQEEAVRLLGVMERRLSEATYLGGDAYSIADIATYPWVSPSIGLVRSAAGEALRPLPSVDRWLAEVGARPAVQRGMALPVV